MSPWRVQSPVTKLVLIDSVPDISRPSNTCYLPSAGVPMTFGEISEVIARFGGEGKFESPDAEEWLLDEVDKAWEYSRDGRTQAAEKVLRAVREQLQKNEMPEDGSPVLAPYCAEDLDLFLGKLAKRLRLVAAGLLPPEGLY